MKRELGTFERALVIADRHAPFHIVSVLCLEGAPSPQIVRHALKVLQNRHPFLSARLLQEKGRYYFVKLIEPGLPIHILPRWNDEHWENVAEVELGNRIDVSNGPLFRCTYLYDSTHERAEIILTLCHAIADAASTARLIHELLKACASFTDEKTVPVHGISPAPPVESSFPSAYRGLRFVLHTLRFALAQLVDEISYRIQTRGKRTPPLHQHPTRGHILSIQLPEDLVNSLSHRARQEEVTLNSALNAAMLIAVNRELYAGQQAPMRTFSFANLRSYVDPPLSDEELACYISMLRYTVEVEGGIDFWTLARDLHEKIYSSLKSGDKFVAAAMTESLIKMITGLKSFRMSTIALNYNGVLPIETSYGNIKVTGVHGFVSAYDLGPELSAQAQLFNDQLFWDFMYLDADMTRDEAIAITEEIRTILSHAVGK
ncbi:MAG: condensation domain-containing protein [Anaerolineae bacterium]|nr:condensation domain-containing protein [Anaerolineae bacterium]MCI0609825.1 condensation domain-containing protein [Anaerolineae bacterium]